MTLTNQQIFGLVVLGPLLLWQSYRPNPRFLKMAGISVIAFELFQIMRSSNPKNPLATPSCASCPQKNPTLYPNKMTVAPEAETEAEAQRVHPLRKRNFG